MDSKVTFNEIKTDKNFFESIILNANIYFAHIRKENENVQKETLAEHSALVMDYFKKVILYNNLEQVIDRLIDGLVSAVDVNDIQLFNCVKHLFIYAIAYHDFGKVNHLFQNQKMNNYHENLKIIQHEIQSHHSILSAYLYILHQSALNQKYNFDDKKVVLLDTITLSFAYPILKHHNSNIDNLIKELGHYFPVNLSTFVELFSLKPEPSFIEEIHKCVLEKVNSTFKQFSDVIEIMYYDEFPLYALVKLNYSLLTASDYLATTHYMCGWKKVLSDFGILSEDQKKKIVFNLRTKKEYNKAVYESLDDFTFQWPQEPSYDNLNQLRTEMAVEVIKNIRQHPDKRLFYIEAPTGGGKTNLSMIALTELLNTDSESGTPQINKIFYVFPFTTLITQTYKAIKDTLGLEESELIEIHSKAGVQAIKSDDQYGSEKLNYLDNLFVNYPIALLSHIKFFDILKTNQKEENYLLHRLANSVVIIDELQSYSPLQWDKMIYFIDHFAHYFNIRFILMSATLPKIGTIDHSSKNSKFESLITNKSRYFQNKNFANRVMFDFSLLDKPAPIDDLAKKDYLNLLSDKVFEESCTYASNNRYIPGRVFTIIEFIYKKTATEFFNIVKQSNTNNFFDELFVLSGSILEPRRKEVIEFIKNKDNQNLRVLLITTQVVEAGVDIDMDLGFKDTSLIDSDEQLAGRINRNVKKPECKLFLFNCDSAKVLYGNDPRYKKLQHDLNSDYQNILKTKNFDLVYDIIIKDRNQWNKGTYAIGLNEYQKFIKNLQFDAINRDFKLIEQNNHSIFVPIVIPINIPSNTVEKNFNKEELNFLKHNGKYKEDEDYVHGKQVWELYEETVKFKHNDFITQKIYLKTMSSLISKYTFSIFAYSNEMKELISRGYLEEKYGFYYLSHLEEGIYDYESGIDASKLTGAIIL